MSSAYQMMPFGPDAPPNLSDISHLHEQLLPRSPIVRLGRRFMEEFYYSILPRQGRIFGTVAYVDGKPAGFVSLTDDSSGFLTEALRDNWALLVGIMARSLVSRTAILAAWEAYRLMSTRDSPAPTEGKESEILSIGVLPEFRSREFVLSTGIRIAHDLMRYSLDELTPRQPALIRAVVDTDNIPAHLFYSSNGWKLEREHLPGWMTPSVEFVWRPEQQDDAQSPAELASSHSTV